MAAGTLAAFWALSFLLVLVPGADWAYAIAAGLRDRSVLPAVAGLLAGYAGLTAVVAAGVLGSRDDRHRRPSARRAPAHLEIINGRGSEVRHAGWAGR